MLGRFVVNKNFIFDGSNDESYLSDQDEETQTTCSAAGHLVIVVLTMPEK
jgi:hypothetical protein